MRILNKSGNKTNVGNKWEWFWRMEKSVKMNKINFYQKKYEALETFYGWIDQGSEYAVAVEQSIYYNHGLEEIDEIIFNITIATRYSRCGKKYQSHSEEGWKLLYLKLRC